MWSLVSGCIEIEAMKRYWTTVMVDGWVEIGVEAESEDEARKYINQEIEEMDFGELRDVGWQFDEITS